MTGPANKPRGAMITKNCEHCETPFTTRLADHKRGWARFCSKACKGRAQNNRAAPLPPSPEEPTA